MKPNKTNTWILTRSGKKVDLLDPDPASITIEDIAWHLSGIGRYTGAASRNISVLEHSFYVMQLVEKLGGSLNQQLGGLLHDAPEAYMSDVATPMKNAVKSVSKLYGAIDTPIDYIDAKLVDAIQTSLGVEFDPEDELIKLADTWAMAFERTALLEPHPEWQFDLSQAPATIIVPKIMPLLPRSAMALAFCKVFHKLKAEVEKEAVKPYQGILREAVPA